MDRRSPASSTLAAICAARPPRYFRWVAPGLGGMPRPGLVQPLEQDLEGLASLGVDVLITLEETRTVDPRLLAEFGVEPRFFPIPDMGAPTLGAAKRHCAEVEALLSGGRSVVLHCKGGYGRTGTMLAAQLIDRGAPAASAIRQVRKMNRYFIQSEQQEDFLRAFGRR